MELTPQTNFNEDFLLPRADAPIVPVYTKSLHELKLQHFCQTQGIPCYLPLRQTWKIHNQVSFKKKSYTYRKTVLRPLFPSYLFAALTHAHRLMLLKTGSVIRFCETESYSQEHLIGELKLVRQMELIGLNSELEVNPAIREGQRFYIESGNLEGSYGTLVKKDKAYYWTVELECVHGVIAARIDPTNYKMTPVPPPSQS